MSAADAGWINLDFESARWAEETAKRIGAAAETTVTNAAAVLARQGPYAMVVFLDGRVKEPKSNAPESCEKKLLERICEALEKIAGLSCPGPIQPAPRPHRAPGQRARAMLKAAARDVETLLVVRRVLQQCLVYLRYQLKAES